MAEVPGPFRARKDDRIYE
jgi:hypothetical protein